MGRDNETQATPQETLDSDISVSQEEIEAADGDVAYAKWLKRRQVIKGSGD
jgi:hypothetical protein